MGVSALINRPSGNAGGDILRPVPVVTYRRLFDYSVFAEETDAGRVVPVLISVDKETANSTAALKTFIAKATNDVERTWA